MNESPVTDILPSEEPPPVEPSRYHDPQQQLAKDDMLDVALLYNAVGTELTMVDKHGLNNTQKAARLDESRVFNNQMTQQSNIPQPVHPPAHPPVQPPPVHAPPIQSISHAQPVAAMISVDNSEIISKISAMEKKVDSLLNVYEQLLDKMVKNSKRMTITINDKD